MIAGPIVPRTRESLWELVLDDPGWLETGLRLLGRDLLLDGGLVVDALARDAAGTPVLLFLSMVDEDRLLPSHVREARAAVERMRPAWTAALSRSGVVDDPGLRADRPARVLIVGFDYTETALAELRGSASPWLSVLRLDSFALGDAQHVVVTAVVDGRTPTAVATAAAAVDAPWPDTDDADLRQSADAFTDLLRRLDPDLRASGDRFGRRYVAPQSSGVVVDLAVRDGRLVATVPGRGSHVLASDAERSAAFDLVLRRYLELAASSGPTVSPEPAADHGAVADRDAEPEPRGASSPFSELRRRLHESELSPQEFDAFHAIDSEP